MSYAGGRLLSRPVRPPGVSFLRIPRTSLHVRSGDGSASPIQSKSTLSPSTPSFFLSPRILAETSQLPRGPEGEDRRGYSPTFFRSSSSFFRRLEVSDRISTQTHLRCGFSPSVPPPPPQLPPVPLGRLCPRIQVEPCRPTTLTRPMVLSTQLT